MSNSKNKTVQEWWSERSKGQKWGIILGVLFVIGMINNSPSSDSSSSTSTTNSNNSSEETSKRVYRRGYSDGQTAYGLPASSRASAYEFYLSRGYNYSSADYYVYEMGYNDGMYGRSKQY